MDFFATLSVILVAAALMSYINHRWLRMPATIGVMVISLLVSLALILLDRVGVGVQGPVRSLMESIGFERVLLDSMLAVLLFAGALHVKVDDLKGQGWIVGILATVGVLFSTVVIGAAMKWVMGQAGIDADWLLCFTFGAIVAPTDPIAVLGIIRRSGAAKSLETKITGESLFNDGIAVVVFTALVAMGAETGEPHLPQAGLLSMLAKEVGVSILLGLFFGWVAYRLLRSIDSYPVELMITLALATGLYSFASSLHSSGPLAVVVAGLFIGNPGRKHAMSHETVERIDLFWELVDEVLNVVLFLMIGFLVLVVPIEMNVFLVGVAAIPLTLMARAVGVGATVAALRKRRTFSPGVVSILTWGGLRGGISVALALSYAAGHEERQPVVLMTYVVVVFSIVVQGLTIGRVVRKIEARNRATM